MNKIIKEIVERIIHIPNDFNKGNKSELILLKESGYFEFHDKVNEIEIIELLKKHSHLVEEWLLFSQDDRSSIKWYFGEVGDGNYIVGHWPVSKEFEEINTMDKFYACALFIKRKVESIRILFKK